MPRASAPLLLLVASVSCFAINAAPAWAQGYAPDEAAARMTVADGFRVELVAAEPLVRQPVAIDFDDRGRLWVIQYLQYPNPAGLKRVSVDRYSRTTYDRVPEPPPHGPRGADRITILEDSDGDGRMDRAKDFVNGLNLTTGFAFGYGGVFVLNVPYLLFYADRDGDDVPDADPEVLLTGFGMEDSSSLANSLMFGPDGWLYGTQGTNIRADIGGVKFEQGVWRYHPVTRKFELFAEGGGNSWGLDFDDAGRLYFSTNSGGYVFDHALQGAYYHKAFGKHGELHNPFAFGYLGPTPHANFQGGHVTVGGLIYNGDTFPPSFRGKYLAADLLGHAFYWHSIAEDGSTVRTAHGGTLFEANDTWFAPSDVALGPDGAIYVADWHDQRTAHPDPDAEWDRSNGRVFRLQAAQAKRNLKQHVDPRTVPSVELVKWLELPDGWSVRRARRVLAERRDPAVIPQLVKWACDSARVQRAREALWTLAGMDAFDEALAARLLDHPDDVIRMWAVRLLGDRGDVSADIGQRLVNMATMDPSPQVRSQLASSAKRLPAELAIPIVQGLLTRSVDRNDRAIPLLIWWAVEAHASEARERVTTAFSSQEAWENAYAREVVLGRLMRRFAAEGSVEALDAAARLFNSAPDNAARRQLLKELDAGLALVGHERKPDLPPGTLFTEFAAAQVGGSSTPTQKKPLHVPANLAAVLDDVWASAADDPVAIRILLRLGKRKAQQRALALARDVRMPVELRVQMLDILGELGDPEAVESLVLLLDDSEPPAVRRGALNALASFSSSTIPGAILAAYGSMNDDLRAAARGVLFGRAEWASVFLSKVEAGAIEPAEVPLDDVRRIALHHDADLDARVRKLWGGVRAGTPEEKLAEMRRLNNDLRAGTGDAENGRALFNKHCGTCHRLFGEGTTIGPDLTQANRHDRDFLLASLVDPSAQVRKEFLSYVVVDANGRVTNGILVEETPASVTLVDAKNQRTVISRDEIEELTPSDVSLMPENLLKPLGPQELRDLFAYLEK